MEYRKYVYSTLGFGIFALGGVIGVIYFSINQQYFLLLISVFIILVSLDNFFCGARLKSCGISTESHYVLPPFLKKKK